VSDPKPPGEGTRTHAVLAAFEPGWQTGHEIARRVKWATASDSCYSFLGTLKARGFIEVDHSGPGIAQYRLTDRGRDALGGTDER
jgi:DNA-binding PadR family transcriptional regulator